MSDIGPTEWAIPSTVVGPWTGELPDDPRYDPVLLREGDTRNVVDAYRYWTREAIIADYALTGQRMKQISARLLRHATYRDMQALSRGIKGAATADEESMAAFLDELHARDLP